MDPRDAQILEIEAEIGRLGEAMAKNDEQEMEWYKNKAINDKFNKIIARFGPPAGEAETLKKFDEEMNRIIKAKIENVENLQGLIKKLGKVIEDQEEASSSSK
ncbi:uncharacterized protein LOC111829725 [Capsella rubella]|uniref:uncharacterized protein LOC111829725 n=1 Tax=Capsella rubella TaxID=81985 RepID=UPI000CD582AF|nr:uncharacterized protein LOC111829725 [Capsella rubella]